MEVSSQLHVPAALPPRKCYRYALTRIIMYCSIYQCGNTARDNRQLFYTELLQNIKQCTVHNFPFCGDGFAFFLHKFFPGSVLLFKVQPVYAVGTTPNHKAERHSSSYILMPFAGYLTAWADTQPTMPSIVKANVTLTPITVTPLGGIHFLNTKKRENTFLSSVPIS
jgi:hypothetical protein